MQHSKHTGSNLKRKITATLLSLAIVGTSAAPLVSTVVANAASAEEDSAVGAARLPHSDNTGIFWANATYFDYYSDNERANGWRNNIQAGTGFNGSEDNWFPFYQFNQKISTIAGSNSAWSKPLYLGNMLPREIPGKTGDEALPYKKSDHNGPIETATNGLTRFDQYANNSNTIGGDHKSVQGLMQPSLKDGKLMATSTLAAPYFDADQLSGYAKIIDAAFPFRVTNENGYTKYSFDSTNGTDNVRFDYSNNEPTKVNYLSGASNAVKDGLRYFMYNTQSGYGIFPFNDKGTEMVGTNKSYQFLYASVDSGYVSNWTNLKVHLIGADSTWPGEQMRWLRDEGNNKTFVAKIP